MIELHGDPKGTQGVPTKGPKGWKSFQTLADLVVFSMLGRFQVFAID